MTSLSLTAKRLRSGLITLSVAASLMATHGIPQTEVRPRDKPWDPSVDSVTKESTGWGYFVRSHKVGLPTPVARPVVQPSHPEESVFLDLARAVDALDGIDDVGPN